MTLKNYHHFFGPEVNKFINLAIAFYGDGSKMKVVFGHEKPEAESSPNSPKA
ncbi:MAG: hypothetical protein LBR11_09205 [Deltaproteobacteria bacterium]|nr:hypothetical protein [Deltaproteobacteria bacterium]